LDFRLERHPLVEADLTAIAGFLLDSAVSFGRSFEEAEDLATERIQAFLRETQALRRAPYRGTLRPELGPGLRNITIDRFIVYFQIEEATKTVRILAVFFGGQDHTRRMLARMLR
jgi:plasmid stabilization system protein ParE